MILWRGGGWGGGSGDGGGNGHRIDQSIDAVMRIFQEINRMRWWMQRHLPCTREVDADGAFNISLIPGHFLFFQFPIVTKLNI